MTAEDTGMSLSTRRSTVNLLLAGLSFVPLGTAVWLHGTDHVAFWGAIGIAACGSPFIYLQEDLKGWNRAVGLVFYAMVFGFLTAVTTPMSPFLQQTIAVLIGIASLCMLGFSITELVKPAAGIRR